ncbi:MAG: endolytic transglycosylase MltG [Erysipelothrix sp.]|nr:endolytic transglycosylase MltG [Erysipelothrix sp.]
MNKKKISFVILASFALLIAALFIGFNSSLKAVSKESEIVNFYVADNDNLTTITQKLEDSNIIKSAFSAKLHGKLISKPSFVVGNFELDRAWSTAEVFKHLETASNVISNEVTVTLIPGSWAKHMAKTLSEKLAVSEDELLTLWNDEEYIKEMIAKYDYLTDDILNDELKVSLEGYLAPNTYNFYVDASPRDITKVLLDQTNLIYKKYENEFNNSDYSIHELFTLASITQYESGKYEDDLIIAGVWYNRLDIGMKLESSVTVCYSLYEYDSWEECEKNTRIDSPFNTYVYAGIPIGPILNPGESSIKATLFPEKTDYLFFIADVYGDNTVYYAKTFAEHQANIDKYLKR